MARFEIHVLVNAGAPYRGRWAPMPYHFGNEADAMAMVEKFRERDRWASGLARSYRVVEKTEATVEDICRELDGYMAELQRDVAGRAR